MFAIVQSALELAGDLVDQLAGCCRQGAMWALNADELPWDRRIYDGSSPQRAIMQPRMHCGRRQNRYPIIILKKVDDKADLIKFDTWLKPYANAFGDLIDDRSQIMAL